MDCVIQRHICDRRRLTVGRPVSSRRLRHPWPGSPAKLGFLFIDKLSGALIGEGARTDQIIFHFLR